MKEFEIGAVRKPLNFMSIQQMALCAVYGTVMTGHACAINAWPPLSCQSPTGCPHLPSNPARSCPAMMRCLVTMCRAQHKEAGAGPRYRHYTVSWPPAAASICIGYRHRVHLKFIVRAFQHISHGVQYRHVKSSNRFKAAGLNYRPQMRQYGNAIYQLSTRGYHGAVILFRKLKINQKLKSMPCIRRFEKCQ